MTGRVREMRASDVEEVGWLLGKCFPPGIARYLPYAQQGVDRFLIDEMGREGTTRPKQFLASVIDHRVVGFAEFRFVGVRSALLAYLCVAGSAQRRGVATELFEYFLSMHPEVEEISLDVFRGNDGAARLYETLGFAAGESSVWAARPLPKATEPLIDFDRSTMDHVHSRYSFSEAHFVWGEQLVKVGRIGREVLRCFDESTYLNDGLLARLRATFPSVNEGLLVGATTAALNLPSRSTTAVQSLRMYWHR